MTAARDALLESLGSVQSTMASLQAQVGDLKDETAELRDFKAAAEDKLAAADVSEATISTLRSSLEDARRTLMRLQSDKEARTSSATLLPAPEASTSTRDKRMSLGVGASKRPERSHHRRISSVSDSGVAMYGSEASGVPLALAPPTVTKGGLRELRLSQAPPPSPAATGTGATSGITSLFSGWGAGGSSTATADVKAAANRASITATDQQQVDISHSSEDDVSPEEARRQALARLQGRTMARVSSAETVPIVDPEEFTQLQHEVQALRKELVAAKLAREASEAACRALREFIAVPQAEREKELEGMSLPPLPSDMRGDSDDEPVAAEKPKPSVISSWFSRKASSNAAAVTSVSPPAPLPLPKDTASTTSVAGSAAVSNVDESTAASSLPPPLQQSKSFISSWTRGVSLSDAPAPSGAPPTPSRSQSLVSEPSTPPPPPAKPSRFNFFSVNKGPAAAALPPAAVAADLEDGSVIPTSAPTTHEEASVEVSVDQSAKDASQPDDSKAGGPSTPPEPAADTEASEDVGQPLITSQESQDGVVGEDGVRSQ